LPRMKILFIPKPSAAGFKAICTQRGKCPAF
jgi:hypothetical protein